MKKIIAWTLLTPLVVFVVVFLAPVWVPVFAIGAFLCSVEWAIDTVTGVRK